MSPPVSVSRPGPARSRRLFPPELPPPPPERAATTVAKGHGRHERRTLRTTTALTVSQRWPGLAQGFELTRERTVGGQTSVAVVYGITSLPPERAAAARLLAVVRDHWRIENALHYVRDMARGEGACRVRKGGAPQVLAALRNAVVHLLSGEGEGGRVAALERLAAGLTRPLQLIGIPLVQ